MSGPFLWVLHYATLRNTGQTTPAALFRPQISEREDIMEKKILFLGLDAAMPDLVNKFVAEGSMPNTAKLLEQGVLSRL